MGLWFVDSYDHVDSEHIGLKYKNPDNPHPELEFQTGSFDSVLKRTGYQSFKGISQKWHGLLSSAVWQGIAFHSSTVSSGIWITQFNPGFPHFYSLIYDTSGINSGLRAVGIHGVIAGPVSITILEGWNYLEWRAELADYDPNSVSYLHRVLLNGEELFSQFSIVQSLGPPHYTAIFPTLGNKDDYYMLLDGGEHTGPLGAIHVHKLMPIDEGHANTWGTSPKRVLAPKHYTFVDDWFNDSRPVPDDNQSYLEDKLELHEETYKMEQLDPQILGLLGFQYCNYCNTPQGEFNSIPISSNVPTLKHHYYNPDDVQRLGSSFQAPRATVFGGSEYEYRTYFHEFPSGSVSTPEIEIGHPNNGSYINDSEFGFFISKGDLPATRVSQFCIEVVLRVPVVTPPPDPAPIELLSIQTFHFTRLWKFELTNGITHRFTNHNINLTHENEIYTPVASLALAAIQRMTGLDPINTEAQGIIDTLTFDNFLFGATRGLKVTEFLLDWQYPWAGAIISNTFILNESSFDGAKWLSQFSSKIKLLTFPKGHVYGRTCRHVLGDSQCKVDLSALLQTAPITLEIPGNTKKRTRWRSFVNANNDAFGNDRSKEGYFNFGDVLFVNGILAGIHREIRASTVPDLNEPTFQHFEIQVPTPVDIPAGTNIHITPGCNKLWSTCKDKFENPTDGDIDCGNTKNFGGFPTIPGKDGIFSPIGEATRVFSNEQVQNWLLDFLIEIFL